MRSGFGGASVLTSVLASLLASMLGTAVGVRAQTSTTSVQPILDVGFIGTGRPALTGGVRWTLAPPPPDTARDPVTGVRPPHVPLWPLQVLATAGVTFARPRNHLVDLTVLAQLGTVRPVARGIVGAAGPVVLVSLRPNAAGAGVRVEGSDHALAVEAGVVWLQHQGSPRALVSADAPVATVCEITHAHC